MRKYFVSVITFLSLINYLHGQSCKEIYMKSVEACKKTRNGKYEMTYLWKSIASIDTQKSSYSCMFNRIEKDSLFNAEFHYKEYQNKNYIGDVLYNKKELIFTSIKDSIAEVESTALWANDIKTVRDNLVFFPAFLGATQDGSFWKTSDTIFSSKKHQFKLGEDEIINNSPCYKIEEILPVEINDTLNPLRIIKASMSFWIEKKTFIPIRIVVKFDLVLNGDAMSEYKEYRLNSYEINILKNEADFSLQSIPSFYKRKNHEN